MRLESFKVRGFGPFKKEWSCDLSELRGLVAVTGVNGAGKSTFLELGLPGALYRQTPTRGSLVDLAVARDACLDVTVVNGARWTLRHLVDGQSGKSEALVLDAEGQPALPDSKVKSYDAWAAKHWPAPEVLMATIFGAQGSGGFLAAKPSERKAILLRMLGVERLEALAANAREQAKAAKAALDTTTARLADERARAGDVEAVEAELEALRRELARAETALTSAQAEANAAIDLAKSCELAEQANAATARARAGIEARLTEARAKAADLKERLANNRAVLADGDAIRAAVARVKELEAEIAAVEAEATAAEGEAREVLAPWADYMSRCATEQDRLHRAEARLKDAAAVEAAKSEQAALRDAADGAEAEVTRLTAKLTELSATHLAGAEERLGKAMANHRAIVKAHDDHDVGADDLAAISREAIESDESAAATAKETPALQREARERLTAAQAARSAALRQLEAANRFAARGPEMDAARVEASEADAELKRLRSGYAAATETAQAKREAAAAERGKVPPLRVLLALEQVSAARATRLEGATARVAELEPQLTDLGELEATLVAELAAAAVPIEVPARPDVAGAQRRVSAAQASLDQVRSGVARVEQRLEEARASAERRTLLEQQLETNQAELADWVRVASDLGKDGLQALEIDAAGPTLTELTNAILHRAHGPRFTVRVETQRLSADGKRQIEGCEVVVLDTVAGREAAGETFSGGERVVIAEALSLAILVLSCRRAGLTDVSLVRDESGAALDPGNARVYVEMLRHAIELTGARHCLLVSHMPEVQELCDSRIEVGK